MYLYIVYKQYNNKQFDEICYFYSLFFHRIEVEPVILWKAFYNKFLLIFGNSNLCRFFVDLTCNLYQLHYFMARNVQNCCFLVDLLFVILQIEAKDSESGLTSYTTVYVEVEDGNDNSPTFTSASYEASVAENSDQGTVVTSTVPVEATDIDSGVLGLVTYSIVGQQDV